MSLTCEKVCEGAFVNSNGKERGRAYFFLRGCIRGASLSLWVCELSWLSTKTVNSGGVENHPSVLCLFTYFATNGCILLSGKLRFSKSKMENICLCDIIFLFYMQFIRLKIE